MHVGIAGPVLTAPLLNWLDVPDDQPAPPPGRGGIPVTLLANELLRRGHRVTIATLDQRVQQPRVFRGDSLQIHVGRYRFPARRRARDGFRQESADIAAALVAAAPDLVHAHWTYEYALGAIKADLPRLTTVHDWAPTIFWLERDPYRFARLLLNIRVLARRQELTAVSPYIKERLERWGCRDVELIPNALPDHRFARRGDPENVGKRRLLAINNGFTRRKNVEALLRALPAIRSRCDAELWLVGAGYGAGEAAHRWAEREKLEAGVRFLGSMDNDALTQILRQTDVFVHPAMEESFGVVLIEAMAQGVPVVAGRSSGAVPWVLDGGAGGVLVDVERPQCLAEGVRALLTDRPAWSRWATAGFEHASRNFRLSTVTDKYERVYERVLCS